MNLHLYPYGKGTELPGISIGVARQAPRGIRIEDRWRRGYFQVWLPQLAPSKALYQAYRAKEISYPQFARRYRGEMKSPEPKHVIALLAATCQTTRVNLGCFCQEDAYCHRSQLAELVREAYRKLPPPPLETSKAFSPPCSMPEIED
ncbi:DUF488 family protein [Pelagicoccus sp. SDUM812002]|uniref:DUF488 domain-containing protein n=1 Tax=Pelagicoccus sp. SDUM812002 TaxID=3041266 RepID=UPI00280DDD7A|nr:DUF488 family protein [Pelagicoccus sp. SDUM812002]MDQ8184628.1 DUF488 family protein [Pelagicoccus sp. SDUM812002]